MVLNDDTEFVAGYDLDYVFLGGVSLNFEDTNTITATRDAVREDTECFTMELLFGNNCGIANDVAGLIEESTICILDRSCKSEKKT